MKLSLPPLSSVHTSTSNLRQGTTTNLISRNSNKACSLKTAPECQAASEWKQERKKVASWYNMMTAIWILINKDVAIKLLVRSVFSWSHHQCFHRSSNSMTLNWVVGGWTCGCLDDKVRSIDQTLFPTFPKHSLHYWWVDPGQTTVHSWETIYSFSSQRTTSVSFFPSSPKIN